MTRLVYIALNHRDRFSEGHLRQVFEYDAYHWAIMISPEPGQGQECSVFEATDASEIDQATFRLNNPTMDWWFRDKDEVDLAISSKLLGRVAIGKAPDGMSHMELKEFFLRIPLPIQNREPQQSCVTWVMNAIRALQRQGWVREFELGAFKDWALLYADDRMKREGATEPEVKHYDA